jgi:hypothetical protein
MHAKLYFIERREPIPKILSYNLYSDIYHI